MLLAFFELLSLEDELNIICVYVVSRGFLPLKKYGPLKVENIYKWLMGFLGIQNTALLSFYVMVVYVTRNCILVVNATYFG